MFYHALRRHDPRSGLTGEIAMAKTTRKRGPTRKPTAPKVSRKMANVRPLRGEPGIARRYDAGYPPPPRDREPWLDEGEPEVNG
jgi:hypothetical protein